MAMDLEQSCYEWPREEYSEQGDSADTLVSQMLDQGSISFGRFTIESLSWEKRSVFTRNRYQEELEKLRAPGLVAQKKAYFEEYYRRIRAMKSLQEKQHIEPTSYCGDSCDISGQIVEEDSETALLESDSPANFSKDNKNCEISPNLRECQILDINYNKNELMMKIIEDNEQHDFIRFGNKQEGVSLGSISGLIGEENHRIVEKESHMVDEFESTIGSGTEKVFTTVKTSLLETDLLAKLFKDYRRDENSGNKHLESWDKKSCDPEPISASTEDSKQLNFMSQDIEEILKKSGKNVPKDCVYHKSSPRVLELKLNKEQKKVNQAVKGYKGCAITPEVKGHCSSLGDFIKSEHRTKSGTVLLTQTLRDSSQKRKDQNNACIISTNQTVDRILSSKYASVASHGSRKEVSTKVTTPRSPFATAKPGISSTRASPKSDRNNILLSSPLPPTNIISKGVSSRLGVPHSQKREKLESRREHEELGKKPLATDREAAYLMGGSPCNVIRPLKSRSVNLPYLHRGDTDVRVNLDKLARNNKVGKLKLPEMEDEIFLKTPKKTKLTREEKQNKKDRTKMASSTIMDLTINNSKKPRCSENSLNQRKLGRQDNPRWR